MKNALKLYLLLGGLWVAPCYGQEKPTLAMKDITAIRQKVMKCWVVPPIKEQIIVWLAVKLKRDGSIEGAPEVLNEAKDEASQKIIKSAVQAVIGCQPFKLPESSYEAWKELEIAFANWEKAPPSAFSQTTKSDWLPVSLKCPVGDKPLEYIQDNGKGRKYRTRVWYKAGVPVRTDSGFGPAKGDSFNSVDLIELANPRSDVDRDVGASILKYAEAEYKIGCLGKPAERKEYFAQLKRNAQKQAGRRVAP